MPFINTKVTTTITKEKEEILKAELGKAITLIGKGEAYLMLGFEDNCRLWFQGNQQGDTAYVEVALLGSVTKENAGKLTSAICDIMERELSISSDRVYVKFSETDVWGFNNIVF